MLEQKTETRRTRMWDVLLFIYVVGIITGIFLMLWIMGEGTG